MCMCKNIKNNICHIEYKSTRYELLYPPVPFNQESCALSRFGWVLLHGPMAQRTVEEDPSCSLIYDTHISIAHYQCLPSWDPSESQDTSNASSYPTDAEVYLRYLGHELNYLTWLTKHVLAHHSCTLPSFL